MLPDWLFNPLEEHVTTLEAEETQRALAIMLAPYSKAIQRKLRWEAERAYARLAGPTHEQEVMDYDPDKAAEWFEAIGAEVVH